MVDSNKKHVKTRSKSLKKSKISEKTGKNAFKASRAYSESLKQMGRGRGE